MAGINKTKFIKTYGIDDDNFLAYLNKFPTLKKMVALERLDVIPKDSIRDLYNRFIYYNSLGHTLNTIVEETTPDIRSLFFQNGNGYFEYKLSSADTTKINSAFARVGISNRICEIKIQFGTLKELNENDLLFDLVPAPFIDSTFNIFSKTGNNAVLKIDNDGIKVANGKLPSSNEFIGTFTYIIKK